MAKKRPVPHDTSSTSAGSTSGKQPAPPLDPKAPAKTAKAPARKTAAKTATAKPRPDTKNATPGAAKRGTGAASKPKPPAMTSAAPAAAPASPAEAPTPAPLVQARKPAAPRVAAKRATSRKAVSTRDTDRAADSLDIVMVASEMHPFATSGGLAEVVCALPPTLTRLGHRVTADHSQVSPCRSRPGIAIANPTPHRPSRQPTPTATFDMGAARSSG